MKDVYTYSINKKYNKAWEFPYLFKNLIFIRFLFEATHWERPANEIPFSQLKGPGQPLEPTEVLGEPFTSKNWGSKVTFLHRLAQSKPFPLCYDPYTKTSTRSIEGLVEDFMILIMDEAKQLTPLSAHYKFELSVRIHVLFGEEREKAYWVPLKARPYINIDDIEWQKAWKQRLEKIFILIMNSANESGEIVQIDGLTLQFSEKLVGIPPEGFVRDLVLAIDERDAYP
ncbi:hypothetical protein HAM_010 (mitochondrion) [Hemiselmis andersenii]|uniref:Uncharacterized protein n=1 Tax=Hemiselmis andersenii TaxID=464988 RepID=B2MWS8_HEMAN|nr:hypothetical protein HAM_010 [Hemiselmis andersenii]ACC78220.1 hypothetical protein HAM_010 [Hemiselmis andersenii]|mmetsp:Transcript_12937/g.31675  ORF Transcript_12937/g.31675 Transcript_12937/m.31675 type:complete len:228 (-) Transcript_12937:91-774(-)